MYRIPSDRAEVEEALTENGFRYHPDPLGRVNRGYWRSEDGETVEGAEVDDLVGVPIPVAGKRRGMQNRKVRREARRGRKIEKKVDKRATEKGWTLRPKLHQKTFSRRVPDYRVRRGNYIELKPDTDSGRRAAKKKVEIYQKTVDETGEKKRVRPMYHRRSFGGGFRLRPRFKSIKPFWLRNLWLP